MNGVPFSVVDLSSIFTYFIVQINYKPKVQYCWLKNHIILFILICLRSWASRPLSFQTACLSKTDPVNVCMCVRVLSVSMREGQTRTHILARPNANILPVPTHPTYSTCKPYIPTYIFQQRSPPKKLLSRLQTSTTPTSKHTYKPTLHPNTRTLQHLHTLQTYTLHHILV